MKVTNLIVVVILGFILLSSHVVESRGSSQGERKLKVKKKNKKHKSHKPHAPNSFLGYEAPTPPFVPATPPVGGSPATLPPVSGSPTTPPLSGSPVTPPSIGGSPTTPPPVSSPTTPPLVGSPIASPPLDGNPVTPPPTGGNPMTPPPVSSSPIAPAPVGGDPPAPPIGSSPTTPTPVGSPTTSPPSGGSPVTPPPLGNSPTSPAPIGGNAPTPPIGGSPTPPSGVRPLTPPAGSNPVPPPPVGNNPSNAPPPVSVSPTTPSGLQLGFYRGLCPNKATDVEALIETKVREQFSKDPTILPALLRMQFHDCFVNGCDASILIAGKTTERRAGPNLTVRGFEFIDVLKAALDAQCPGVVSCADIIAIATKVVIKLGGGPDYAVQTGRRDGLRSNVNDVDLPSPSLTVSQTVAAFAAKGFTAEEMVTLLGTSD